MKRQEFPLGRILGIQIGLVTADGNRGRGDVGVGQAGHCALATCSRRPRESAAVNLNTRLTGNYPDNFEHR